MRSLRPVSDPRRANPEPDRVRLKIANAPGTFAALVAKFGGGVLSPEDASILNGVVVDEPIASGRWLKIVEAGHRR
jgi:predicted Zn-dependent protease